MKPRFHSCLSTIVIAAATALGTSSAHSASITWDTPTAIVDANDVSITGTSILAYTYNTATQIVNTVSFSNSLTQSGITLVLNGSAGNGPYFAPATGGGTPTSLTGTYRNMINWGAWETTSFSFSGLTEGQQYQLQFWTADYRSFGTQYTRSLTLTAGNTSGSLTQLHTDSSGVNLGSVSGSYILGTFTADAGGTQSITIAGDSNVNGIQVRNITGVWNGGASTNLNSGDANFAGGSYSTISGLAAPVTSLCFADTDGFGNSMTGKNSITVDAAGFSAGSLNFQNNSVNYTLQNASGDTGITGTTALNKSGTGTLTLTGTNTYTGVTTISAGTLQIGNGTDAGSIASSASITNNGALVYNVGSGDRTYAGVISGTGSLTKQGSGTLTLTQLPGFTGNITVSGGQLAITAGTHGQYASGAFHIGNGTLGIGSSGYEEIGMTYGVTIAFDAPGGGVFKLGSGANFYSYAGSSYQFTSAGGAQNRIEGGSGGGNLNLNNKLADFNVVRGTDPTSDLKVVSGFWNSTNGLTKTGNGILELAGANTYTGDTAIDDGTLAVASTGSLRFKLNGNSSNRITGTASASLTYDGALNLDLSAAALAHGNSWLLIDVNGFSPAASFGSNFHVTSNLGSFTQTTPGVWSLTSGIYTWSFDESTGELTLDIGNDYDTWGSAYGLTAGSEGGDLDNDGLTNGEEHAFGLIPNSGSSVNPITSQFNKTSGQFTYQRRDNGLTGLNYTIWYSTDLSTWTEDTGATQPDGTPDGNGVETITVTLSPALLTNPKLFIQVRAN